MSVEGGYKVLPRTPFERVFQQLADAKWFLVVHWCEQRSSPTGILINTGQISFQNKAAILMGEEFFIPPIYRPAIFQRCLSLAPLETALYRIPFSDGVCDRSLEIQGIEIDPRYGKVALISEYNSGIAITQSQPIQLCIS